MAGGGDSVMWLRVEDEDIGAAKLLRVTVSKSTTGNGKKRTTSFVCKGTLHRGKDDKMGEYARAQKKVKADPRKDEGLQLELQRDMMANFRKQKRERETDNLVDPGEDDDEGGEHLCFLHSLPLHSYAAPVSLSPHTEPYAHSNCPLPLIACLGPHR